VLASTICAPVSCSWGTLTPFTVAAVPTGMKRGVSTGPWGVWNRPQRAAVRGQRAVTSKLNGNPAEGGGCKGVGLSPVRYRSYVPPALPRFGSPAWLRDLAGAWIFYSVLPAWPGIAPRFERIARFAPCIGLVLAFRDSSRLAGAYGIAVTATMAITSILYYLVTRRNWGWPIWKSLPLLALFLLFDFAFLGANLLKILDGGWFTLTIATLVMIAMTTWRDGRALLAKRYSESRLPVDVFLNDLKSYKPYRSNGTAVFMSVTQDGVPITLLHHFKHNDTIHERVVLLSIVSTETPQVDRHERLDLDDLGQGFYRVIARFGFMETPNVPKIMTLLAEKGLALDIHSTSFFLGRETLLTTGSATMPGWRKRLFTFMSRNAWNVTSLFGIPPGRVVELGSQVEL